MVADHVAKRRASMLALARRIPGLLSPDDLVSTGESEICRLLLELHQRGPIPEDHFSWLVDQFIARSIEFQRAYLAGQAFEILGPVPTTRVEAGTATSLVWSRYEGANKEFGVRDLRDRSNSPPARETTDR